MIISKFIDLTNQSFGKLYVIKRIENHTTKSGKSYPQWLCKCECGNYKNATSLSLSSGHTKSCGCLNNCKNIYIEYEDYYILVIDDKYHVIFDKDDYERINICNWHVRDNGYIYCNQLGYMHRYIMKCNDGLEVDHINNDRSDNRKSNLRVCTRQKNSFNRSINYTSDSKIFGVQKTKSGKWMSQIKFNGKRIYLGIYSDFYQAVKIRLKHEKELFGDYGSQKHLYYLLDLDDENYKTELDKFVKDGELS